MLAGQQIGEDVIIPSGRAQGTGNKTRARRLLRIGGPPSGCKPPRRRSPARTRIWPPSSHLAWTSPVIGVENVARAVPEPPLNSLRTIEMADVPVKNEDIIEKDMEAKHMMENT